MNYTTGNNDPYISVNSGSNCKVRRTDSFYSGNLSINKIILPIFISGIIYAGTVEKVPQHTQQYPTSIVMEKTPTDSHITITVNNGNDALFQGMLLLAEKITKESFALDGEIVDIVDKNLQKMLW